jgi:hypothetical protein
MQFTDQERTEIAAEHDRIAAGLFSEVERLEKLGKADQARRLWNQANDVADVADAARISSAALARVY